MGRILSNELISKIEVISRVVRTGEVYSRVDISYSLIIINILLVILILTIVFFEGKKALRRRQMRRCSSEIAYCQEWQYKLEEHLKKNGKEIPYFLLRNSFFTTQGPAYNPGEDVRSLSEAIKKLPISSQGREYFFDLLNWCDYKYSLKDKKYKIKTIAKDKRGSLYQKKFFLELRGYENHKNYCRNK